MPRYFSNTTSFIQMQAVGDLPSDVFNWLSNCLTSTSFSSIEETADELSIGWTRSDNIEDSTFDVPIAFRRDHHALFSLRVDQRRVASAVLKAHVVREEKKFIAENPNFRKPPKEKREEIKELVKLRLLATAHPVPSVIDVTWNFTTGVVTLFSTSTSAIDRFEDIFKKTFAGVHLTLIHPYARAKGLLNGALLEALIAANQANSDDVTALISSNRWIGNEFLLWLLYRGLNDASEYIVNITGHSKEGEKFSAWIDDRIIMEGDSEGGGVQKVAVTGSQDLYKEVRSALTSNKQITSATICMEYGENQWKLALKGDTFAFNSFKCPQIHIEQGATVDEVSEMEAVFFEKTYLQEQGLQYFDSLYLAFLRARLGSSWGDQLRLINEWLEHGTQQ